MQKFKTFWRWAWGAVTAVVLSVIIGIIPWLYFLFLTANENPGDAYGDYVLIFIGISFMAFFYSLAISVPLLVGINVIINIVRDKRKKRSQLH